MLNNKIYSAFVCLLLMSLLSQCMDNKMPQTNEVEVVIGFKEGAFKTVREHYHFELKFDADIKNFDTIEALYGKEKHKYISLYDDLEKRKFRYKWRPVGEWLQKMREEKEIERRELEFQKNRPILQKIYYACQMGSSKWIDTYYQEHGLKFFNQPICNRSSTCGEFPLIIAINNKQWDIVLKLINLGTNLEIMSDFDIDKNTNLMHHVASTKDQSEKKLQVLDTLVTKNLDINAVHGDGHPFKKSALYKYISANSSSIDHNDRILKWFIDNGVDIKGVKTKDTNIFMNVISACDHKYDTIRITKAICHSIFKPLHNKLFTFFCCVKNFNKNNPSCKLVKPIHYAITNLMLQDELPVKKISQALLQDHRTWIPMDYFIQSLKNINNFKHEREIFNPERWETNPLEQYRACAPVQKK